MGAERVPGQVRAAWTPGEAGDGNKILAVGAFGILFGLPELQSHGETFNPSDVLRVNHFYKSVPVRRLESAWLRWVGRLGLHKLVFAGLLVPHLCPTVTGLSA